MIYIPVKYLKPKMVVARNVTLYTYPIPLIVVGQELTEISISKLLRYKINGVYIENEMFSDIEVEDFIEPKLKKEIISEIKGFYNDYTFQKSISATTLKSVTKLAENLIMFVLSKEECIINIVDVKDHDSYTYTHSMYVALISVMIGIQKGYDRSVLTELAICGMLHDVGKIDVPVNIINKTSALTPEEFDIMKMHPTYAVNRLRSCNQIPFTVLSGVGSHHEKFDGTGYPDGLRGTSIPLYGRIVALADVYDALTSQRSYRQAWTSDETVEYMMGCADTHFDYDLLTAFLKTVAAYPVGTVVKLSNGYMGVVIQNSSDNILRPRIRLLNNDFKVIVGNEIDLANDMEFLNVTIVGTLDESIILP